MFQNLNLRPCPRQRRDRRGGYSFWEVTVYITIVATVGAMFAQLSVSLLGEARRLTHDTNGQSAQLAWELRVGSARGWSLSKGPQGVVLHVSEHSYHSGADGLYRNGLPRATGIGWTLTEHDDGSLLIELAAVPQKSPANKQEKPLSRSISIRCPPAARMQP